VAPFVAVVIAAAAHQRRRGRHQAGHNCEGECLVQPAPERAGDQIGEEGLPSDRRACVDGEQREWTQSVSDLALAERVQPQSMAQTVGDLEADGYVERRPDPHDRRRALVELTGPGLATLQADRRDRWLANAIAEDLSAREQAILADVVPLLRRLAES
jgi:DNA-binding MarR family transcriptional regulator